MMRLQVQSGNVEKRMAPYGQSPCLDAEVRFRMQAGYLHETPSYTKASEGYPPVTKSAEASIHRPTKHTARDTHSSTGIGRGLLRTRIKFS
jgi:hypothetical protein